MPVPVRCPKCEAAYNCPDTHRGKNLRCPKCQTTFRVAAEPVSPPAVKPPRRSREEEPDARAERPTPKGKATPKKGAPVVLIVGIIAAVFLLLCGGGAVAVVGGAWYWLASIDPQPPTRLAGDVRPPDTAVMVEPTRPRDPPKPPPQPEPGKVPELTWKDFTSKEAGFAARFPGTPAEKVSPMPNGKARLEFSTQAATGQVFQVMTVDLGKDALPGGPQPFLDRMAKAYGEAVKSRKDVKAGEHSGVELVVEQGQDTARVVITMRLFVVRNRMYHLTVVGAPDRKDDPAVATFLDSFQLLETPSEPPPTPTPGPGAVGVQEMKDKVAAWLKENNKFGPDHKMVTEEPKQLDTLKEGWGFWYGVGSGLTKSGKPTILAGWRGQFFVLDLPAGSGRKAGLADNLVTFKGMPPVGEAKPGKQALVLSDLKIDKDLAVGASKQFEGSVAYRKVGDPEAMLLQIRFTYMLGNKVHHRVSIMEKYLLAESGTHAFKQFPFDQQDREFKGVTVFFGEVIGFTGQVNNTPILSNLVAVPVIVTRLDLGELTVKSPDGWKSEYNKVLRGWSFEKNTPGAGGLNDTSSLRVREYIDNLTMDGYAAKMAQKDFVDIEWVCTQVSEKKEIPGGFLIKGKFENHVNKKEKPRLGLVMVREVNGFPLIATSSSLRSEALREEAIGLFNSATLDADK